MNKRYTIALDFDGTLVRNNYPAIGKAIPQAVETVKKLLRDGHRIILWTVREGKLLEEAVQWCADHGITLYAANKNYPEEQPGDSGYSRKINADIFIDDCSFGGLPAWDAIYAAIQNGKPYEPPFVTTVIDPIQEKMMKRFKTRRF